MVLQADIQFDQGDVVCYEQLTSGTGVFDGSVPIGWARLPYTTGGVVAKFASRDIGTAGNGYSIVLVDPQSALAACRVSIYPYQGTGQQYRVEVALKHNGTVVTATAADVSAALAAAKVPGSQEPCPVRFGVTTDGTMAAMAEANLAGGVDAAISGPVYSFTAPTNGNGGMFFFGNREPQEILQVDASAPIVSVQIADVTDGLDTVTGKITDVANSYMAGVSLLGPRQVILVTVGSSGLVRVWARRASRRQ